MYGLIVRWRNRQFDRGRKTSVEFDLPVICIGNLSVGGTGKTPHTEYLIRLLKDEFRLAVLSRGYKRKTKGFVMADEHSDAGVIGDEPQQYHRKFSDICVAVDEKRVEGVRQILARRPDTQAILLDDAFQHRHIKPGLSILLTDFKRPFYEDRLLPFGRLREPVDGKKRADIIVVTKCPADLSREEQLQICGRIRPEAHQKVFFSTIDYGTVCQGNTVCGSLSDGLLPEAFAGRPALALSGIARPEPFEECVRRLDPLAKCLRFPDHHDFSSEDAKKIAAAFESLKSRNGIVLTTEKDYARLEPHFQEKHFSDLAPYIYSIGITVRFLNDEGGLFNQTIRDYVRNHTTDRPMA